MQSPPQSSQDDVTPRKVIVSSKHLDAFIQSATHKDVLRFIHQLDSSVLGIPLQHDCPTSDAVNSICEVLQNVEDLLQLHPPIDNSVSRFGNPAFRSFYDDISVSVLMWHEQKLNIRGDSAVEVSKYFLESWGDRHRVDYGSGMELNFLCWLLCLEHLGIVQESDYRAMVLRVFWRYILVMRKVQATYWLEPAGSHGVWGLDDYHFLPFLFGAAQLQGHKHLRPKSIHDPDVMEGFADQYMYLACIKFINSIKTESLRWHSPMLDDISGAKSWEKVNTGMLKMYEAEVLGKLPVAQHFMFGRLLPFPHDFVLDQEEGGDSKSNNGHHHGPSVKGWGECCGIKVPSQFAVVATAQQQQPGIRRIPFD